MSIEIISILVLSILLIGFLILLPQKRKADVTMGKFNWIGGLFSGALSFMFGAFLIYAHQAGWDTAWPKGFAWDVSSLILSIVFILTGLARIIKSIRNRHSVENHF
jgi:uncharacterized membrane protein